MDSHNKKISNELLNKVFTSECVCFCKKPVNRSFTHEYGPILECANYAKANSKLAKVCGFHFHEFSWEKFQKLVKTNGEIAEDDPELRCCPAQNLTFCALFSATNDYTKMPPSTPLCFCDRPVVIKETRGIEFTCRNASIVFEGVRKCTWGLPTEKIAFPKPQYVLHRRVTEEQFRTRWDEITQKYRKQSKEKRKAMEEAILSGKSWPLKSTPETPKPIKMIVPTSVMLNKNSHYNSQT